MLARLAVAGATVLAALAALPAVASADDRGTEATFGGTTITLDDGSWDGATACAVVTEGIQCFATEAEMDAWLAKAVPAAVAPSPQLATGRTTMAAAAALTCSSSLRLYENSYFGGRTIFISARGQWHNLSAFGFSNRTSSFKVGACSAYLADLDNGGGAWYPGSSAFTNVAAMSSVWNDRISSVYLV